MAQKIIGRYRQDTLRLRTWDYSSPGTYFVAIITKRLQPFFGSVNSKLQYTEIGDIAVKYWQEIRDHFPFVEPGPFIVMPNHVHGLIKINAHEAEGLEIQSSEDEDIASSQDAASTPVRANDRERVRAAVSGSDRNIPTKNKFGPQSKNPGSIIRGYKAAVKKYATMNNIVFFWHARYHDRIVRNEKAYSRIVQYIENNPAKWKEDSLSFSDNNEMFDLPE